MQSTILETGRMVCTPTAVLFAKPLQKQLNDGADDFIGEVDRMARAQQVEHADEVLVHAASGGTCVEAGEECISPPHPEST